MLTPVAFIVNVVPTTVLDTLVPLVVDEFNAAACGVLITVPTNELNNLTSEIVNVYPELSNTWLLPK